MEQYFKSQIYYRKSAAIPERNNRGKLFTHDGYKMNNLYFKYLNSDINTAWKFTDKPLIKVVIEKKRALDHSGTDLLFIDNTQESKAYGADP